MRTRFFLRYFAKLQSENGKERERDALRRLKTLNKRSWFGLFLRGERLLVARVSADFCLCPMLWLDQCMLLCGLSDVYRGATIYENFAIAFSRLEFSGMMFTALYTCVRKYLANFLIVTGKNVLHKFRIFLFYQFIRVLSISRTKSISVYSIRQKRMINL